MQIQNKNSFDPFLIENSLKFARNQPITTIVPQSSNILEYLIVNSQGFKTDIRTKAYRYRSEMFDLININPDTHQILSPYEGNPVLKFIIKNIHSAFYVYFKMDREDRSFRSEGIQIRHKYERQLHNWNFRSDTGDDGYDNYKSYIRQKLPQVSLSMQKAINFRIYLKLNLTNI
ncbi:hypothetical protein [Dongshaea marina]|uniref:hypothetical protein n=1 Tax=Dongshaea marina TaxID=2047966 RepID=UPI000D3E5D8D|nr:hypothetical protein [Dongshaea marina]